MNYMVVRGEETKRVLLDEIAVLLLENNAISMTGCLLSALIEKKIKVVLCDQRRSPQAELVPFYGAHNDVLKIRQQIEWDAEAKKNVWTDIVRQKIRNQARLLSAVQKDKESEMLRGYTEQLQEGDLTNREGHAAKVYFNALFGMSFSRRDDDNVINSQLNYGYSLILSAFNREVIGNGYLTQLGLGHNNQFNHFNLSSDLMEPFRIIVDRFVMEHPTEEFGTEEKHILADVLNQTVVISQTNQTVLNAIKLYTKSVLDAIQEKDIQLIKHVEI